MTARRAICFPLVLVLLAAGPMLATAGTPLTESVLPGDDAGTGRDAPAESLPGPGAIAPRLDAGTYEGNVTYLDLKDVYRIVPPPRSLIRVTVLETSHPVQVSLLDSVPQWRGSSEALPGHAAVVSAIGEPGGDWHIQIYSSFVYTVPTKVHYRFSVEFEAHAESARFVLSAADLLAFRAHQPDPAYLRVETKLLMGVDGEGGGALVDYMVKEGGAPVFRFAPAFGGYGMDPRPLEVRSEGLPEIGVDTPRTGAAVAAGGVVYTWHQSSGTAAEVTYGFAATTGALVDIRLLWDGNVTPEFLDGAWGRFATVSEFEGGNRSLAAGPYAAAEGARLDVTFPEAGRGILLVDALSTLHDNRAPHLRVTHGADLRRDLVDDGAFWRTDPRGGSMEGRWDVEAVAVDGLEAGYVRVMAAHFPFP